MGKKQRLAVRAGLAGIIGLGLQIGAGSVAARADTPVCNGTLSMGAIAASAEQLAEQCVNNAQTDAGIDSTGSGLLPSAYVPPTSLLTSIAAKEERLADITPYVSAMVADQVSVTALEGEATANNNSTPAAPTYAAENLASSTCKGPDGTSCPPRTQDVANQPIHAEGDGNGGVGYTCGPSSTRNMVQGMTGTDYGEAHFVDAEHTSSSDGTDIGNIASALNSQFSNYDSWELEKPSSPADLLTYAVSDVHYGHHGVIQNVNTIKLPFWGTHKARHYDLIEGYDTAGDGKIHIAEEWNHPYQNSPSPFGHQVAAATDDYAAVTSSPSGQIVW